jgi:hypothetical protein
MSAVPKSTNACMGKALRREDAMRRLAGGAARVRWVLGALAVVTLAFASPAEALCARQQEDGRWVNVDPNTRDFTRIQLRFICQDQVLNGQLYPPGPPWYVHVWGKCLPNDCDWGEVDARRLDSGHVYAVFDQGFVKTYIYAKMSQYRPGQLWVYAWTDFRDPSRPDFALQSWFQRQ